MTTAAYAYAPRKEARALEPASEPNVIPFIDVLLVLLIIFMVTAPKPTTDIPIDLPVRPQLIAVVIPPTIVDIIATPDGYRIFVGADEVALEDLSALVMARGLATHAALTDSDVLADAHVSVRAQDQGVAYGNVVAVLDTLRHAGFAKVGVFAQLAE